MKPAYCAISVPKATPSIFIPKPKTSVSEASMFTMFCMMEMNMGIRVFCIPINQPIRLMSANEAGAPQMTTLK